MLQRKNGVGVVRVGVLALAVLAGCTGRTDGEDTSSSSSGTPASSSSSGNVGSSSRASSSRASSGVSASGGSSSRVSSSTGQSSSAPATSQPASSTSTTGSGTSTAASGTSTAGSGSSTAGSSSVDTSSSLAQSSSDTGASGSGGASSVGGSSSVDMSSSGGASSSGGVSSSGGLSSSGGSSSGGGGAVCGNGVPEGLEECDDGNMVDNDDCTNGCLTAVCGDGIVNDLGINPALVEECDDTNTENNDACTNACANARCGDGFLYALNENCDDGNGDNTDGCPDLAPAVPDGRTYCQPARCGDGFVQGGVEGCDDGNGVNTDACPDGTGAFCAPAFCGDAFVQQGVEQCDTGGTPTAQCDAQCYVLPRRFVEVEPNNVFTTANNIGTFTLVQAAIQPADDVDVFAFTVTQVVHLTAETSNPFGTCQGSFDTRMALFDEGEAELAYNNDIDFSTNYCSRVSPATHPGTRSLVPGRTYYLMVDLASSTATASEYRLQLTLTPNVCGDGYQGGTEECEGTPGCNPATCTPTCGDGIVTPPAETCDSVPGCDSMVCRPVCGDGVVLAPEDCDDGPGQVPPVGGDGCSTACRYEYPTEVEPNGSNTPPDVPTPIPGPGILGSVSAGEDDFFAITLNTLSHVRLETTDATGGCPGDTLLALLGPDGVTSLATDDDDGIGACSLITPQADQGARLLQPGTYFVRVSGYSATTAVNNYLLKVSVLPNVCGDAFVGGTEVCDDGNMNPNDGCDNCAPRCGDGVIGVGETCDGTPPPAGCDPMTCITVCGDGIVLAPEQCDDGPGQVPPVAGDGCGLTCQYEYPQEVEPNNTTAEANANAALALPGVRGDVTPSTEADVFMVNVAVAGTTLRFYTETSLNTCASVGATDTRLEFLNSAGTVLASDSDDNFGYCSYLGPGPSPAGTGGNDAALTNLAAGTYYIRVTAELGAVIPTYTLRMEVLLPFCGNAITNPGEQCDDGNANDTDSCRNDCTLNLVVTPELEPNSDRADAIGNGALPTGSDGWSAVINGPTALPTPGPGDQDWFMFTVPPGPAVNVRAEVSDGVNVCPFDSFLELRNAANTVLVSDGDDGIGACSLIDPLTDLGARGLAPGNYFLMVRHNSATNTFTGPYVLKVTLSAPACGNSITESGEQCDDGNMVAGDGCAACMYEMGFTGEVEMNGSCASTSSGVGNVCTPAEVTASTPAANVMAFDATGTGRIDGSINPGGDDDWFAFDVVTAGPVSVRTGPLIGTGCPGDTVIDVFTAAGTSALVQDDDDGVLACSFVGPASVPTSGTTDSGNGGSDAAMANLAVGRYYVRVHAYGSTSTIAGYRLTVTRAP